MLNVAESFARHTFISNGILVFQYRKIDISIKFNGKHYQIHGLQVILMTKGNNTVNVTTITITTATTIVNHVLCKMDAFNYCILGIFIIFTVVLAPRGKRTVHNRVYRFSKE